MMKDGFHFPVAQGRIDRKGNGTEEGRIGLGVTGHSKVMMKGLEDRPAISDARVSTGAEKLRKTLRPDDVSVIDVLVVRRADRHR